MVGCVPLKGAVDAQKETIVTQKEFRQGLQTVLDATDSPKMLERFEAYKKLNDLAADAVKQDLERRLSEEKDRVPQRASVAAA